jgi:hypothetical protein
MQSLINEIKSVNESLIIGIKDTYKMFGLCKRTVRESETQTFEIETKNQVIVDDTYSSTFYHVLIGTEFTEDRAPGKKKLYNATTSIRLVCFSNQLDFDEHILNRLSNVRLLTIKNKDDDAQKIISEETAKKTFNFHNNLFVVNYQILYKTDNCYESCQ